MKRNLLFVIAVVFFATVNISVNAQGVFQRIVKPDAVGGSFVATHQDGLVKSTSAGPGLELFLKYKISPKMFITTGAGISTIYDDMLSYKSFKTTLLPTAEIKAGYNLFSVKHFSPFVFAGLQAYRWKSKLPVNVGPYYDGGAFVGGGIEYAINDQWSFNVSGDYRYIFTDDSNPKSKFWVAKSGLTYSLKSASRKKKEEIEYPLGTGDLALDDLFKEDTTGSGSEKDALAKLFEPEKGGSASLQPSGEAKTTYSNSEIGQLMAKIQNLKDEMEQRMNQIEELQAKVESNEKAIAEISRNVAGEYAGYSRGSFGVLSAREFKRRYQAALQKFYNRQYKEAIRDFTQLMNSDPDNRLASNCQYWIGESYNALHQYRKAIDAFNAVLRYKASYKFDDALLMSGLCHLKIGDKSTAREEFQQLVSRFPDSEYAPKAMRYLGRL